MATGPFLPFAQLGVISASGLQKTGNEAFTIVGCGGILVLLGVFGIILRKRFAFYNFLCGLACIGLTYYYQGALEDQFDSTKSTILGSPSIGAGLYVCYFGGALAIAGGLTCIEQRRQGRRPSTSSSRPQTNATLSRRAS
jgi:hypothetical protein